MLDTPSNANLSTVTRSRRRWLQYSLRSLFAVMLVSAGIARWMAANAEAQKAAVQAILEDGGHVTYDFQRPRQDSAGRLLPPSNPPGPEWLRRFLGDDYFVNVINARISTDSGLLRIGGLSKLEQLYRLPVSGGRPRITDAGIKNISGLNRLVSVDLADSRITDDGLAYLEGLDQLQNLNLAYTSVTDDGLKHLADLTQLRWLNLSGTQFSGTGLKHLSGLSHLESLDLSRSMVTDEGLERVKALKSLKWLNLAASIQFSEESVAALRKALPDCQIQR